MIKHIIPFILIILYTIGSAFWNKYRIQKSNKKHIVHWTEDLLIQGVFTAVIAFIYSGSWLGLVWLFLAMTALYWIIFDPLLNRLRNKDVWCYLSYGNYVDRFLLLFPCWLRHLIKVTVFGIFVYLSFKT